jgi:hypothetical protein
MIKPVVAPRGTGAYARGDPALWTPGRNTDNVLTPLDLIQKIPIRFDLDPCGYPGHDTARRLICPPEDGLAAEWSGCVWLNCPYSDSAPWLGKLKAHGDGIALVMVVSDTVWWQQLIRTADGLLFIRGRPPFKMMFEGVEQPKWKMTRAVMLAAFGKSAAMALNLADGIGGTWVEGPLKSLERRGSKYRDG